jgi:rhamnulokinase
MKNKYFLAIDLGASSGRHVVGYLKNGNVVLNEVHRFITGMDDSEDDKVWDLERIFNEIKIGISKAFAKYTNIESLSIDTWGVDYVLMNSDKEIKPFYAYRNSRLNEAYKKLHEKVPFDDLYNTTGIQFASFNTIYQLYDDLNKGRLNEATDYLMLPSYFTYKLTGVKTHEYTNESTGALIDPNNKNYAFDLIDRVGLPRKLFNKISSPGECVGELTKEIQKEVGGNTKVILCASHDTASAFESVEVSDDSIILSSGTWSLLGIKSKNPVISTKSFKANYTNEGGINYIRFLKNIMGMWLINELRKEINYTFDFLALNLPLVTYKETFDVNDESLLAPSSMKQAILDLLKVKPNNDLELFASVYHSLALCYKEAIEELEDITNKKYSKIYVLGGGAKNVYLNNLIKEYTNKEVVAKPIEATSLGNIKIQMKASKIL